MATTTTDATAAPRIVILPTPGIGHIIPVVEFAKILHRNHGFSTTILIPNSGPLDTIQENFLSTLPPAINYDLLPPVKVNDLPPDVKVETRISITVKRSLPSIRDAVKSLDAGKKLAAFVVDIFGGDAFEIAVELGIPPYVFFTSTAMALSLFHYMVELDKTVSCEYRDAPEMIRIPGCIPVHGKDLFDPIQDRKNDAYRWILHHSEKYKIAEGIILNSFKELEPDAISTLLQQKFDNGKATVYPIGPLVHNGPTSEGDLQIYPCLQWLDEQPNGSVLYVSFGSGGSLSHSQITELAIGLELSEQRFLWVIRCPNEENSGANYFGIDKSNDPIAYLPLGFLERTKNRGLVVPLWAPQSEILAHKSIGGFLTHGGWNSTLESIVNGVAMIVWPLYAEQRMNAVILSDSVRVALRANLGENGLVGRMQVANLVKGLMEGEGEGEVGKPIRRRIGELKQAAAEAVGEHGDSTTSLRQLVDRWQSGIGQC